MAHHEDYLDGRQAARTDLIAVLSERFDWSKPTIKTLDPLGGERMSDQRKSGKALSTLGFVEAGPEFRLGGWGGENMVPCSKRIVQVLENSIQESDFLRLQILISCSRSFWRKESRGCRTPCTVCNRKEGISMFGLLIRGCLFTWGLLLLLGGSFCRAWKGKLTTPGQKSGYQEIEAWSHGGHSAWNHCPEKECSSPGIIFDRKWSIFMFDQVIPDFGAQLLASKWKHVIEIDSQKKWQYVVHVVWTWCMSHDLNKVSRYAEKQKQLWKTE